MFQWLHYEQRRRTSVYLDCQTRRCDEIFDVFLGVRTRLKAVLGRQLRYEPGQAEYVLLSPLLTSFSILSGHLPPESDFLGDAGYIRHKWVEERQAIQLVRRLKEDSEQPAVRLLGRDGILCQADQKGSGYIYGCGMLTLLEVAKSAQVREPTVSC